MARLPSFPPGRRRRRRAVSYQVLLQAVNLEDLARSLSRRRRSPHKNLFGSLRKSVKEMPNASEIMIFERGPLKEGRKDRARGDSISGQGGNSTALNLFRYISRQDTT